MAMGTFPTVQYENEREEPFSQRSMFSVFFFCCSPFYLFPFTEIWGKTARLKRIRVNLTLIDGRFVMIAIITNLFPVICIYIFACSLLWWQTNVLRFVTDCPLGMININEMQRIISSAYYYYCWCKCNGRDSSSIQIMMAIIYWWILQ